MDYRLIRIDELTIDQHYYLDNDDRCFYLMEYTSGKGFDYSPGNQLISNLKKSLDRKGLPEWGYKRLAINKIGRILKKLFDPAEVATLTFVPIPPSKHKDDESYDDRMVQVLEKLCEGWKSDVREILYMFESMQAVHETKGRRPSPDELAEYLCVDEKLCNPAPKKIVIFDDVITAGAHFKACQKLLAERFPKAQIVGLFVARRIIPKDEVELLP